MTRLLSAPERPYNSPWPFHHVLLSIYPVVFLASHNVESVRPGHILMPLLISLGSALAIYAVLHRILKDRARAALLVTILAVCFFGYGHVYSAIEGPGTSMSAEAGRFLLLDWLVIFAILAILVIRTRKRLDGATAVLNVAAAVMLGLALTSIAPSLFVNAVSANDALEPAPTTPAPPDLYYIILDAYARKDALAEFYGYDNSEFVDFLKNRGFFVAEESISNYAITYLSLSSSLNMQYLRGLGGSDTDKMRVVLEEMNHSRILRFLRARGYRYIHFDCGYSMTSDNEYADEIIRTGGLSEFEMVLFRTTLLRAIQSAGPVQLARKARLLTFDLIPKVERPGRPDFIFAHILMPHAPYIFGPEGEEVEGAQLVMGGKNLHKEKKKYIDQLVFTNNRVREMVDEILRKKGPRPVIVIQGDHGTSSSSNDWVHPTESLLRERMGILNAYYLPDGGNSVLYKSISPVNSFRLILNRYMGAGFSVLEDRALFSSYESPYQFRDVTNVVRRSPEGGPAK